MFTIFTLLINLFIYLLSGFAMSWKSFCTHFNYLFILSLHLCFPRPHFPIIIPSPIQLYCVLFFPFSSILLAFIYICLGNMFPVMLFVCPNYLDWAVLIVSTSDLFSFFFFSYSSIYNSLSPWNSCRRSPNIFLCRIKFVYCSRFIMPCHWTTSDCTFNYCNIYEIFPLISS